MSEVCQGRVLIVGAGIAGLVAASHLFKHGFKDVTVLEAENRIGGRIHTIPYGGGNLEMGAQWIHGEIDNPLCEYALDNGLVNSDDDQTTGEGRGCYYTQSGQVIDSALVKEVQQIMDAADDDCCTFCKEESLSDEVQEGGSFNEHSLPSSVEDFFEERFRCYLEKTSDSPEVRKLKEGLYRWHLTFQCLDNACYSMRQVSAVTWGEFQYYEGEHWVNLPSGYDSVLQALCKTIRKENILTNKCVTSIDWGERWPVDELPANEFYRSEIRNASNNHIQESSNSAKHGFAVRVKCKDGSCFLADTVVLTMSLGVLKNCHEMLFRPPLPATKKRVIENMGFGTLNKIFLVFDKPFWEKSTEGFQLVWTDEDAPNSPTEITSHGYPWYKDMTGFDVVPNHSNILMGWIGRHGAEVMETLSEEEVGDTCLKILKKFTNCQTTKLVKVIRSSWRSSSNFRGSYSFRTVQSDKEGSHTKDLAAPIVSRHHRCANHPLLHFAGEATETHRFSTVHGAFISGKRVAENIVFHSKYERDDPF